MADAARGGAQKRQDQPGESGADGLPEEPGARQDAAGAAGALGRRARQEGAVVGRLKEAEPEAAQRHPPDHVQSRRMGRQQRQQDEARRQQREADPAQDSGGIAVGEAAGQRRREAHGHRPGVISNPVSTAERPSTSWMKNGSETRARLAAANEHTEVTTESAKTGRLNRLTASIG